LVVEKNGFDVLICIVLYKASSLWKAESFKKVGSFKGSFKNLAKHIP